MAFQQAKRTTRPLRLMFYGPSGSGKSTSAIRIASGISSRIGGKERVAAFDTENSLGILASAPDGTGYDFDVMVPDKIPGTSKFDLGPSAYIRAFDAAEEAGYKILVIDSLSHLWHATLD